MTNLSENFTFGIEIEYIRADTSTVADAIAEAGVNCQAQRYNHMTQSFWKVVTDASLGYQSAGEVVSPILRGEAGLADLRKVLDAVNSIPTVRVDRRCGLHVHLAWNGMNEEQIKKIVARYAEFEDSIDAFMAPSRRGNASRWCKSIKSGFAAEAARENYIGRGRYTQDRYHKVNLQSYLRQRTLEFRQHQGTTDYDKISHWVRFLVSFVEASKQTSGASADYRPRSGSKAYAALREQVETSGGAMEYSGRKWKVTGSNGVEQTYEIEELNALHVGADTELHWHDWKSAQWKLKQDKLAEFWARHFDAEVDHIFRGVPSNVAEFLSIRAAQFAAA